MNTQDWFPLGWTCWIPFAVQCNHKSLLQHHSTKASIILHSAFFIVQLSYPCMTTGKTIALTRWTVGNHVRHYWQNRGTAPNLLSSFHRHRPRMKELALVILTCSFLSSVELAGRNVKVLERSMRKHKAFYSCAQKIIYKVIIDICSRIFTKNVLGWACRLQLEAMGRIVIWDPFVRQIFVAKQVCWV